MKKIFLYLLLCFAFQSYGQSYAAQPNYISISYFGEGISHPGGKISIDYVLKRWNKTNKSGRGLAKTRRKTAIVGLNLGGFYHKRYQSAFFIMPEISYLNANKKGYFYDAGLGLGYLKSFVPEVFEVDKNGNVSKTSAGNHFGTLGLHIGFGQDLYLAKKSPIKYYIKPTFFIAIPNFPNMLGYFFIDAGIAFKLW